MEQEDYKKLTECRICGSNDFFKYLDLGDIPLVNNYVNPTSGEKEDEIYPLQILFCKECALSQLSVVVNPEKLYSKYAYRSSISKTFIDHCNLLAESICHKFKVKKDDLVVDIASNDGCLLREFKKEGVLVLGIDPAENLVDIANKDGLDSLSRFWNKETAKEVLWKYGKAKIITATNVFAHVHDIHEFLDAVNILLKEYGVFIIEVPYLMNFINKTEFDTSYHEHLSYFLIKPIIYLLDKHNLELFDVEQFMIHGGAIRLYIKKSSNKSIKGRPHSIQWLIDLEKDLGLHDVTKYERFSEDANKIKDDFIRTLAELKNKGVKIAAYGASAKGNVLLNYCGINKDTISFIIDDTPEKQGKLAPGVHIPIVDFSYLEKEKPDYLVLLAWNFTTELMSKTKEYYNKGGRYIIPVPTIKVI